MNKLQDMLTKEIYSKVKWMCGDVCITIDRQVFNLSSEKRLKERYKSGSVGYQVFGRFRSKKWINRNCYQVLGIFDE